MLQADIAEFIGCGAPEDSYVNLRIFVAEHFLAVNGISGAEGVLRNAVDAAALHIAVYKGSETHLAVCIGLAGSHVGHDLQHRAMGIR